MSAAKKIWCLWTWLGSMLVLAGSTVLGADLGASLTIGTTGLGVDLTVGINENLNARIGLHGFSKTFRPDVEEDEGAEGEEEEDTDVTVKLSLQTIPLLLDWHPSAENFRLSAGLVVNNNKISLTAEPGQSVELNDVDYEVENFAGDVTFNSVSPYFGLGYGNAAKEGGRVVFSFDLGLMYHGSPKISMQATASDPALQAALDNDVDAEIAELQKDVNPFKFYPVLNLGVSYRF